MKKEGKREVCSTTFIYWKRSTFLHTRDHQRSSCISIFQAHEKLYLTPSVIFQLGELTAVLGTQKVLLINKKE